jgi:subtilisin-like proprotein convertase family protein
MRIALSVEKRFFAFALATFILFANTLPLYATTFSYSGPRIPIPDFTPAGINITIPVTGMPTIGDVNVQFTPTGLAACNNTVGTLGAAIDHTDISDLKLKLTSPAGTSVTFFDRRGTGANNFCSVLFDDDGGFPSISTVGAFAGPLAGNFAPETPLSVFDGQNGNGNWVLNVSDNAGIDTGSIATFSMGLAPVAAANASISGRITKPDGRGIGNVAVALAGGNSSETRYARTNPFGYYRFPDVEIGQTYILSVAAKRFSFSNPTRVITLQNDLTDADFVAN